MNDEDVAKRIAAKLGSGTDDLAPDTLARLRAARSAALAKLEHAPSRQMAWAGATARSHHDKPRLADPRVWVAMVLVVGVIGIGGYWKSTQQIREIEEIDAGILTSDLPINAYLDKGFDAWLKRSLP